MSLIRKSLFDTEWPSLFSMRPDFSWPASLVDALSDVSIRVEEFEEEGTHVIRAEAPGIDPDKDVDLSVSDGRLHLTVRRTKEEHSKDAKQHRDEFQYGSFTRVLSLPPTASIDNVKAHYENGILEVRVPLDGDKTKAQQIPITKK